MIGKRDNVPKLAAVVYEPTLEQKRRKKHLVEYVRENQQWTRNVMHTLAVSFSRLLTHEFEEDLDIIWIIFILRKIHIWSYDFQQSIANGKSGSLVNAQTRVVLELEQIREPSWLLNKTVELALDNTLRLRNVTSIHAQVIKHKWLSVCFKSLKYYSVNRINYALWAFLLSKL